MGCSIWICCAWLLICRVFSGVVAPQAPLLQAYLPGASQPQTRVSFSRFIPAQISPWGFAAPDPRFVFEVHSCSDISLGLRAPDPRQRAFAPWNPNEGALPLSTPQSVHFLLPDAL